MTHTEKVHVLFGVLTAITGGTALWSVYHPRSAARYIWPVLTLLLGFFDLFPLERGTRTYVEVGWWQTFVSAFPGPGDWQTYATVWLEKLKTRHVLQHKLTGLAVMATAGIEWARAIAVLKASSWRWVLPVGLLAIGCGLGIHGGTHAHLSHGVEVLHHRIYGVCFAVAGSVLALVESGRLAPRWRSVWPLLVIAAGVDLMLFYRLS